MFAIYTQAGQTFSGSLERLRRVEKNQASRKAKTAADNSAELLERDELPSSYGVSDKAVAQYRALLQREEQREPVYHAYQVMSTDVKFIHQSWSLMHAFEQFKHFSYHVFPIINDRRELVGSLSREQFYSFLLNQGAAIDKQKYSVRRCFVSPDTKVYAADPVTDVRRIASLMFEKRLEALPVLEESGRILGIVSRSDILRCAETDPPLSLWC